MEAGAASASDPRLDGEGAAPCRYFTMGNCRAGDRCLFSHAATSETKVDREQCKFFLKGSCIFGNDCRNLHASSCAAPKSPVAVDSSDLSANFQSQSFTSRSWADAPEFVPRALQNPTLDTLSWAQVVNPVAMAEMTIAEAESQLCPYGAVGECRYGEHCAYVHGDVCDMCGKATLHPLHEEQRNCHKFTCLRQHEEDMEHAFAVAKSKDKTCGICMEVVMDKGNGEARFGIMPNCNHCFCLSCLRKWRQAKFEHKIIRACPECRQTSDYICPSRYWVDTPEAKAKLLTDYRQALNRKQCKYFNHGAGECPFGNKCFYRHEDSNGRPVDVGPPPRRERSCEDADGELSLLQTYFIYDYLEARDSRGGAGLLVPLEVLDGLSLNDLDNDLDS